MNESIMRIWDELVFYGPAFASIFAVLALGMLALLFLIIFKQIKKKGSDISHTPKTKESSENKGEIDKG